jgi:predicted RNA-binding protein YlxR (DUF448 family)
LTLKRWERAISSMAENSHEPIRTCVGCRERHPQVSLIRLGRRKEKVVIIDDKSGVTGRTIYLCPREDCWRRATKQERLAFKASKYDKIIVYLDSKERDALLMRLKRYCRERDSLN